MKKILIVFIGFVFLLFLFTLFSGYSLVLPISGRSVVEKIECIDGKINPLEKFDFTQGDWKMYIVIDLYDMDDLPIGTRKVNCFKTTNLTLLNGLKENWNFQCERGDMATVSSSLYLKHNGKIVFTSGLMMNSLQEGLQSKNFGWIFSNNKIISKELDSFKRVYSPLIFL